MTATAPTGFNTEALDALVGYAATLWGTDEKSTRTRLARYLIRGPESGPSLCPEAEKRAAMTDAEFWDHVADSLNPPQFDPSDLPGWEPFDDLDDPCPTCGATSACAFDDDGRPLIHATEHTL